MKFEYYLKECNELFFTNFQENYSEIKGSGKTNVLYYSGIMYRRWYCSAFFENNVLSPCNLMYRLNKQENRYIGVNIRPISIKRNNGFIRTLISYTLERHPIVYDLKKFIEFFEDGIMVSKDGEIDGDTTELLNDLSVFDPFYVKYLLNVAKTLGLLKKMPSIHMSFYYISEEYKSLYKLSYKKILKKIVDACIEIAVEKLSEAVPDFIDFFDDDLIKHMLINCSSVYDILKEIYEMSGFENAEELLNMKIDETDEMSMAILSTTYYLISMFDRWVITPFGHYLKFIQPIYTDTYKIKRDMEFFRMYPSFNENEKIALFLPCQQYFSTFLLEDYFETGALPDPYNNIFQKFSIEKIFETVIKNARINIYAESFKENWDCSYVYEIKITYVDDKKRWKVIEIQDDKTLEQLHVEICRAMLLNPCNNNYSIFLDEEKSCFNEYTSPKNTKRKTKKADTKALNDLNLEIGRCFYYKMGKSLDEINFEYGNKEIEFKLDILKRKKLKAGESYPRITRISRAEKEYEEKIRKH